MNQELIAPCGMNCGICSRHLALQNQVRSRGINISYCTGCRARNRPCALVKKRCRLLLDGKVQYCFECDAFPCKNLVKLDARYRANFRMSMIENLEYIKREDIEKFSGKRKRQSGNVLIAEE